ncbi:MULTISPECIES: MerR family transcriptional regulator [Robiginitalea]|uniref:Transcriptional regulator, MerR family protein n=1 Tax=Robiginitalea biformata (strain ATCC BAA-864 / DSM 15991 / KCTC 12146 / HTCC2501) TaxID=313596 RepID=A4CMX7_ROBBH|nr:MULTISPECIES: MerR family transcriptional regulator [Robiginitalea]EAR15019.1 transcriptional regulator, MerR family protein [Robiginitalea biformata HTCC2501]MDC6355165.1 MerR family transcriptional regulator [Robiginitalea sp. PM2]MDC6375620.1 MerR family transcriptional regulator [Robiginitalea sp. SP8]
MNSVKQSFGIRDLENLSGIKAHTIRIWEKRYNLLEPERTATNIRTYSLSSLQKLLNVTLLYNNGLKISKIAEIPEEEIPQHVRELVAEKSVKSHAINAFKLAMINFDLSMFQRTYASLSAEKSFREIFWEVFLPLLDELGLLWQTDTISPAHEHFITHLIKQKIYTCTEKLHTIEPTRRDKTFILYLPENEIHEIGLLFLNYELLMHGYRTVYLGPTIPMENLSDLKGYVEHPVYISYFTVLPALEDIPDYLETFREAHLMINGSELWILGRQVQDLEKSQLPKGVRAFNSIEELLTGV